jgi:hypothetical protein
MKANVILLCAAGFLLLVYEIYNAVTFVAEYCNPVRAFLLEMFYNILFAVLAVVIYICVYGIVTETGIDTIFGWFKV